MAWHQAGLRDADGTGECWHDYAFIEGVDDGMWQVPGEQWQMIGLGEWSACGLTLAGRAVCFPEPFEHAGEQHPPWLEDL